MPDQQRLKLLVISMMYEPDCVGIAAIASDMCAALAERGHDVTVFTTFPYYPEWKLKGPVNRWRIKQESIRDVDVRRHRIFVPSDPSRLFPRLVHELTFPISLLRSLFYRKQFDVVMVFCPLIGGMVFAVLRKWLFRDPLWINIQDIPVEAAAASGIMRSSMLSRVATRVQKFLFNRADVWSSISPDMVQKLETIKTTEMPIHLCPNWLTGPLQEQIRQVPDKAQPVSQRPTQLLYCGTIGKKQGLLQFCQRLSQCDGEFRFQIRGEGSAADAVRRWVETSGDRRFEYDKLLSQTEFVAAIHAADWFVIPQKSSTGCPFFPSKLIPSISIGTPILAISEDSGPLGHEVTKHGLGLVVPWSQVDRLTIDLDVFRRDPARFANLQANCIRRAQAFSRDVAIDNFEALLQEQCCRAGVESLESILPEQSNGRVPTA